jgi:hypothetical protein
MTNKQVAQALVDGKAGASSNNMHTVRAGDNYVLYSYATPVAVRTADGSIQITNRRFSATTSKQLFEVKQAAFDFELVEQEQIREVAGTRFFNEPSRIS